jgi:hypothetical protein
MVREVTSSQCGILFDRRALDQYRVQKDLLGSPRHIGGREKMLDMQDIKSPIVDRLRPKLGLSPWWLTEFLPIHEKWQDESGEWHQKWRSAFSFFLFVGLDAHAATLPVSISEEAVIFDGHLTAPLSTYISPFESGWSH